MKDLAHHGTKVWVISLLYNRADIMRESFAKSRSTMLLHGEGFEHVFVQHHYPINKKQNARETEQIARNYGGTYLDPGKNLGLHHGFNWAMNQLKIEDHHYIIMLDGDNYCETIGWDDALVRVLHYDPKMVWSTLWQPAVRDHGKNVGMAKRVIDHINVWVPDVAFVKTVACWKAGFLKSIGGFHEPTDFWGHLESDMFTRVRSLGMIDCYLPDFYESSAPSHRNDETYQMWKVAHAHEWSFKQDYEAYLRFKKLDHLIGPQ